MELKDLKEGIIIEGPFWEEPIKIDKLPRIRFLIADDPGAGKTIIARLILKELKLRRLANRILIVVPWSFKGPMEKRIKREVSGICCCD